MLIPRRSFITGAAAAIATPVRAWFPHGAPVVSPPSFTTSIIYHSSWDTNSAGGGGPGTGFTGTTFPGGYLNGAIASAGWNATQWYNAVNAVFNQVITDLKALVNSTGTVYAWAGFGIYPGSGSPFPNGTLASNSPSPQTFSFSQAKTYLINMQTAHPDSIKTSAYGASGASLPATDTSGAVTWMAAQNWINLLTNGSTYPGANTNPVGWSNSVTWDYTVNGSTCQAGYYSLYGMIQHELSFIIIGRPQPAVGFPNPFDMFAYSAANTIDYTYTDVGRYYSVDRGTTILAYGNGAGTPSSADDFNRNSTPTYLGPYIDPINTGRPSALTQIDGKYFALFLPLSSAGKTLAGI